MSGPGNDQIMNYSELLIEIANSKESLKFNSDTYSPKNMMAGRGQGLFLNFRFKFILPEKNIRV